MWTRTAGGDMPCLRLEDEGARVDILCTREVLCRIGAAVQGYLDGARPHLRRVPSLKLEE
ncbi:MAG TPA: hypothetical protein VHR47_07270 [Bacillota bacterium]|nr:hypothetical protein [Bacillota bacterium]